MFRHIFASALLALSTPALVSSAAIETAEQNVEIHHDGADINMRRAQKALQVDSKVEAETTMQTETKPVIQSKMERISHEHKKTKVQSKYERLANSNVKIQYGLDTGSAGSESKKSEKELETRFNSNYGFESRQFGDVGQTYRSELICCSVVYL